MRCALNAMSKKNIQDCIRDNLDSYFHDLRGAEPHSVHDMVMHAVEKPMLEVVMKKADGNQLRASAMLGINRNTLRKKLTDYGLDPAQLRVND